MSIFRKQGKWYPYIFLLTKTLRGGSKVTPEQSLSRSRAKEYLSDEPTRWFPRERWYIPSKSEGGDRGGYSKENKILWPKDMFPVHRGGSSLSVLFRWCVPACKTERKTPLPMDPYHCVYWAPIIQKYLHTVLFMNLHKGFVWLLCSGKIVLVLRHKKYSVRWRDM